AKVVEERTDFPFIAVSPQCPKIALQNWSDHADTLNALLDDILASYAIDPDHVYLTGMSMGGGGTWYLASQHPYRFAAIPPICSPGPRYGLLDVVCTLKDMPIWTFHGAKDDIVPISETEQLLAALRKCGGDARFTIYPEATHDSWTETYN